MKKLFLFAVLFSSVSLGFVSCNNGDYNANPNGSTGINPLNPPGGIDQNFDWSGTDPMSAQVNGVGWTADNASIYTSPTDQSSYFVYGQSNAGDTSIITFQLKKNLVVAGQTYFIDFGNTDHTASYDAKISDGTKIYSSNLTTPGQIKILESDATHIKALFFFLSKSPITGLYTNISKGYFNLSF